MTRSHPDGVTLDDYVDDALPPAERAAVDEHLRGCADCRELVTGLRSVVTAVSTLGPLEPPRAAWPRIERAIRGRNLDRRAPRWRWLAAAAALVLATFAGLKLAGVWQQPASTSVATAPASDAAYVQAEVMAAEQHYQNVISTLERAAGSEKGTLDPQIASTLEKSLAAVDQAISESRAALKARPDSEPAQQSLLENFKSKIALLQDTMALINEMRKGNEAGTSRLVTGLKQKGT
jgi:anti-sigma factor RsiW